MSEVAGYVGGDYEDQVANFLKLDCSTVCFNDDVMHFAIVDLTCKIRDRAKDGG